MNTYADAIAVYNEGEGRRVEFRLQDIEKLIACGAAQMLGYETVAALRTSVEFRRDPSGAVTGANVLIVEV